MNTPAEAAPGGSVQDLSFDVLCPSVPLSADEMSGRTADGRGYDAVSGGSCVRVREEPLSHLHPIVQSVLVRYVKKVSGYAADGTLVCECPVGQVGERAGPTRGIAHSDHGCAEA